MSSLLPLFVLLAVVASSLGALDDKLHYYEVLSSEDVRTRTKRSVNSGDGSPAEHEMSLQIFNLTLKCHLHPRKELFAPTFRLVVIDGSEEKLINDFDKDQFLVGTCEGDDASDIHGYFPDGIFQGIVTYNKVLYVVEPAKRHMKEKRPGELHGKMIAYRSSDMIRDKNEGEKGPSFCGASHIDGQKKHSRHGKGSKRRGGAGGKSRVKRDTARVPYNWNTCRIMAVADYKFYRFTGGGDIYTTAAYIASTMEVVDTIYNNLVFDLGMNYDITGLGFEIAEMQINVNPTSGYNADQANWEPLELLQMFGRNLDFKQFCAAHLFTHQKFSGNVLGLAYIASPEPESAGGICSPTRFIGEVETALNTGWSTTLNSNGDTVLARQAQLVTAHGHNWGSEHDPDTDSCAPSSLFGNGKYLMYAYSVNGYDSNNDKFSTCSMNDMAPVLMAKATSCFSPATDEDSVCGNGLIDPEEQCDAGYLGRFGLDPCCNSQCQLIGESTCSPVNHACCQDCSTAAAGTQCLGETETTCYNASYCDGVSLSCPTPPYKPLGASCIDLGQCDGNGVCNPFCEARGKVTCSCDQVSESCQRCCRDNATSECKPYDNNHPLPNSRPCVVGYCYNGVCQKSENSAIQRLFDVLESLTIDGILEFFRNNLVGCTMVFSLILWIPLSCCISYRDRRQRRDLKRQVKVDLREDRDFLYDEDGRRVVRPLEPSSSTPRTPRSMAPRRLPPLMSPRNKELVHQRNRIMPIGGHSSVDTY